MCIQYIHIVHTIQLNINKTLSNLSHYLHSARLVVNVCFITYMYICYGQRRLLWEMLYPLKIENRWNCIRFLVLDVNGQIRNASISSTFLRLKIKLCIGASIYVYYESNNCYLTAVIKINVYYIGKYNC